MVVSTYAYVSIDAFGKVLQCEELYTRNVASPFPSPNLGNTHVLLTTPTSNRTGIIISDKVYGLYMFLVKDGRVYSLDCVNYPVGLNPVKFHENSPEINW